MLSVVLFFYRKNALLWHIVGDWRLAIEQAIINLFANRKFDPWNKETNFSQHAWVLVCIVRKYSIQWISIYFGSQLPHKKWIKEEQEHQYSDIQNSKLAIKTLSVFQCLFSFSVLLYFYYLLLCAESNTFLLNVFFFLSFFPYVIVDGRRRGGDIVIGWTEFI